MSRIHSHVNKAANAALILAVLLVAGGLARQYLRATPKAGPAAAAAKLELPGVRWGEAGQTLVLALDMACTYCAHDAPFYRALARAAAERGSPRLIAVFQHDAGEGRKYLEENGIEVGEVRQARLRTLGVTGTPTVLLVDGEGNLSRRWVGSLNEQQQVEILNLIRGSAGAGLPALVPDVPDAPPAPVPLDDASAVAPAQPRGSDDLPEWVDAAALQSALGGPRRITVLDIDPREDYARSHVRGAMNIPLDELFIRCLDEVPKSDTVVIYARRNNEVMARMAINKLSSSGYKHLSVLGGGLDGWEREGLPIEGAPHTR